MGQSGFPARVPALLTGAFCPLTIGAMAQAAEALPVKLICGALCLAEDLFRDVCGTRTSLYHWARPD